MGGFLSASRVKGPPSESEQKVHLLAEPGGAEVCGEGCSHLRVQLRTQGLQLQRIRGTHVCRSSLEIQMHRFTHHIACDIIYLAILGGGESSWAGLGYGPQ